MLVELNSKELLEINGGLIDPVQQQAFILGTMVGAALHMAYNSIIHTFWP
jgi:hypothetical protein